MLPMIAVVIVKPERTGKDGRTYAASNEVQTYKALGSGQAANFGSGGMKPANTAPAAGSGQSASAPWKRSAA